MSTTEFSPYSTPSSKVTSVKRKNISKSSRKSQKVVPNKTKKGYSAFSRISLEDATKSMGCDKIYELDVEVEFTRAKDEEIEELEKLKQLLKTTLSSHIKRPNRGVSSKIA